MRASILAMIVAALLLALAASGRSSAGSDFCARCDTSGLRYRLLRGEAGAEAGAEAEQCQRGLYCDCDLGKQRQCLAALIGRRFNEAAQSCEFNFDCRAWLQAHPADVVA